MLKQLIALVVVGGVIWLALQGVGVEELKERSGLIPAATPPSVVNFEKKIGGVQFLAYTDAQYGFSLKYPVGYAIVFQPDLFVQVRVIALQYASSAEVYDVSVFEAQDAERAFIDAKNALEGKLLEEKQLTINGRKAFLLNSLVENPVDGDEKLFARQAFYDCGTYTALFTGIIPLGLSDDLGLADYMIYEFKC